jgi:hypothetical protein
MLKSVLLDIQINLNIQQVLKKVLIITFVRAAADAAGNAFGPSALLQHCKQCWIIMAMLDNNNGRF